MSILKLIRRIQAWHNEQKIIDELSSRSDHELNDIGVRRDEIRFIIRNS